jgi:hypothetical protein
MNWKEPVMANFRYYLGIYLEGQRRKNVSKDSQPPGRYLNSGPPDYEAGMLTSRPSRILTRCASVKQEHTQTQRHAVCIWNTKRRMERTGFGSTLVAPLAL